MANYGNNNRSGGYGNNTRGTTAAAPAAARTEGEKSDALLSTGLFTPKNPDSKAVASVQIKEAVTLSAGSVIHLLPVDPTKYKKNPPAFKMVIFPARK